MISDTSLFCEHEDYAIRAYSGPNKDKIQEMTPNQLYVDSGSNIVVRIGNKVFNILRKDNKLWIHESAALYTNRHLKDVKKIIAEI